MKITDVRSYTLSVPLAKPWKIAGIMMAEMTATIVEVEADKRIFDEMIAVASGKLCKAEKLGQRDFCIFKIGINF
jgi:altronate dehydratase